MQEDDHEGSGIVAHFPAHAGQPLSCMSFDLRYKFILSLFFPCWDQIEVKALQAVYFFT